MSEPNLDNLAKCAIRVGELEQQLQSALAEVARLKEQLKAANELTAKVSERIGGDSKVSLGVERCGPSSRAKYEVGIGANWFCYCATKQDAKLVVELLIAHRARTQPNSSDAVTGDK